MSVEEDEKNASSPLSDWREEWKTDLTALSLFTKTSQETVTSYFIFPPFFSVSFVLSFSTLSLSFFLSFYLSIFLSLNLFSTLPPPLSLSLTLLLPSLPPVSPPPSLLSQWKATSWARGLNTVATLRLDNTVYTMWLLYISPPLIYLNTCLQEKQMSKCTIFSIWTEMHMIY